MFEFLLSVRIVISAVLVACLLYIPKADYTHFLCAISWEYGAYKTYVEYRSKRQLFIAVLIIVAFWSTALI